MAHDIDEQSRQLIVNMQLSDIQLMSRRNAQQTGGPPRETDAELAMETYRRELQTLAPSGLGHVQPPIQGLGTPNVQPGTTASGPSQAFAMIDRSGMPDVGISKAGPSNFDTPEARSKIADERQGQDHGNGKKRGLQEEENDGQDLQLMMLRRLYGVGGIVPTSGLSAATQRPGAPSRETTLEGKEELERRHHFTRSSNQKPDPSGYRERAKALEKFPQVLAEAYQALFPDPTVSSLSRYTIPEQAIFERLRAYTHTLHHAELKATTVRAQAGFEGRPETEKQYYQALGVMVSYRWPDDTNAALNHQGEIDRYRLATIVVLKVGLETWEGYKGKHGFKSKKRETERQHQVQWHMKLIHDLEHAAGSKEEGRERKRKKEEETETTCTACGDAMLLSHVVASCCPCGHHYCNECLAHLFTTATVDESLYPPKCCGKDIPLEQAGARLPSKVKIDFVRKRVEYHTKNRTYCHQAQCSTFIPPERIGSSDVAKCPECSRTTCTICKGQSHQGDCPRDTETQKLLDLAKGNGWQRCRTCRRVVELDVGCNHIRKQSAPSPVFQSSPVRFPLTDITLKN